MTAELATIIDFIRYGASRFGAAGLTFGHSYDNALDEATHLVLQTLHMPHEREIKALLGIPAHVHTAALVPVGHPRRKHGPPRRIPAAERTHRERWGAR